MSEVKKGLHYTKTHEWVKDNQDGSYQLGISDYAQEALGDMVFVELPQVGDSFEAKQGFVVAESVKAASDIYAPIALEVISVNETLNDNPERINSDCYDSGYLLVFKGDLNLNDLMDSQAYEAFLASE